MLSSIHKSLLSSFFIVALILLLPVASADAEEILVCVATENAFDALDNNCDGDVDDTNELDNLGLITGSNWYKTMAVGIPAALCTTGSESSQCFSSQDVGGCTHSESGGYYCDVSYDGTSTSGSSSNPTQSSSSSTGSTGSTGSTTPASTPSNKSNGNPICAYFLGVEKCLTDKDNGNDCVAAGNALYYCSEKPKQQPDPSICVATSEVYNGIDDNCDGKIDEGLEQPSTVTPSAPTVTDTGDTPLQENAATLVSAPATAFLFSLGLITLLYTRRKSLIAKSK